MAIQILAIEGRSAIRRECEKIARTQDERFNQKESAPSERSLGKPKRGEPNMSAPGTDHVTGRNDDRATLSERALRFRNERFDTFLQPLTAHIRRFAVDRTIESAIELSRLSEIVQRSTDLNSTRLLLPLIRTVLATRVQGLIDLQYGDLDDCLDCLAENLRGLVAGKVLESARKLQHLREHIRKNGEGQPSRWLIGSIEGALGQSIVFSVNPGRFISRTECNRAPVNPPLIAAATIGPPP